jgi:predicted aspartyl protease
LPLAFCLAITTIFNANLLIYSGKVILDNQEYEIPVYAGDELTEILLGSAWLEFLPLVVNFQADILTLG